MTCCARSPPPAFSPVVVFITAHDEHAIRAFDVQALDYVLKPVTEERVLTAVSRAIARLGEHRRADLSEEFTRLLDRVDRSRREARIPVKGDRGVKLVPVSEIHWIEADADLVKLHTARGAHVLRTTMADVERQVPRTQFVRVHRGAIVNIDCIHEIQPLFKGDYVIVLKSGVRGPIGPHLPRRRPGADAEGLGTGRPNRLRRNAKSAAFSAGPSFRPNVCPGTARLVTPGGLQPFGS